MTPATMAQLHSACFSTPRPWSEAEFTSLIQQTGVFVHTQDDTGLILGRAVLDEVELLTLAVAPGARRRGLARQLVSDFERDSKARGARRAFLEVAQNNAPAIALYESLGYCQIGLRPGYYKGQTAQNIAALVMEKTLETR